MHFCVVGGGLPGGWGWVRGVLIQLSLSTTNVNPDRFLTGKVTGLFCGADADCGEEMECSGPAGNETCSCVLGYAARFDGICGKLL